MNRTCASTATRAACAWSHARSLAQSAAAAAFVTLLLTGCTSIRPVAKIGLIAPFEGLYRETGYEALDALRLAIDTCAPAGMDVLPVALDDSNRPAAARRAAAKLLVDPALAAVIGPFSLEASLAAAPELAPSQVTWIAPYMVDEQGGFAAPAEDPQWLAALIAAVSVAAQAQGAQGLTVAGIPQAWLDAVGRAINANAPPIPVRLANLDIGDPADPGPSGALLWLGDPHLGSRLQSALHTDRPDAAFWMGPQGAGPVFFAHATNRGPIYWVTWADSQYNLSSLQADRHFPAAFLTYTAACQVLEALAGGSATPAQPLSVQVYRLMEDGNSQPVQVDFGSR